MALLGVAYGLVLQAGQLNANQLQISRVMQLEAIKLAIDNPELRAVSIDPSDPDLKKKIGLFLNFRLKRMELSYSVKAVSAASVRLQARLIFGEGYPLEWWETVRDIYATEAATRRERQFFSIVDGEFMRIKTQMQGLSKTRDGESYST